MKDFIKLFWCVVGCELIGIIGGVFTVDAIPEWYMNLSKPSFSPPNWIFGPVWTTLYFLMAVAFYLILKQDLKKKKVKEASAFFLSQLALNFIWTPIFFGLRSTLLGLLVIMPLWILIAITIKKFYPLSKPAAYMLIPYLLWVTFATILNASLWYLN